MAVTAPRTPRLPTHWWSSERTQAWALVMALVLIDILPLEVWQIVLGGLRGIGPLEPLAPLWLLAGVGLLAAVVGARLQGRGLAGALVVSLPLAMAVYLMLLIVSPAAYGTLAGGPLGLAWAPALVRDLSTGGIRLVSLFWLLVLLAYVWWRGLLVTTEPPAQFQVVRRFGLSAGAVILGVVCVMAVRPLARPSVSTALTLLLPGEIFVGLSGCALARIAQYREQHPDDPAGAGTQARWISTALGAAALLVGFTLLLSLVVNAGDIGAALRALGPIGAAIADGVQRLIDMITALLIRLFGTGTTQPVQVQPLPRDADPHASFQCKPSPTHFCPQNTTHPLSPEIQHLAIILLEIACIAVVVALFVYVVRHLVLRRRLLIEGEGWDEEAEDLDARSLLNAQLRALIAGLRGRGRQDAGEELPVGSVRALYRDVLVAAESRAVGRLPAETPDEYAGRLAVSAPIRIAEGTSEDMSRLTAAYNQARYGGRGADKPDGQRNGRADSSLARAAARIISLLRDVPSSAAHPPGRT